MKELKQLPRLNCDPVTLREVIKIELSEQWDQIPPSTRAVMLGVAVGLENLLAPGTPLAEAICEYLSRHKRKAGGRPEGSLEEKTEYVLELFSEMPGAKPAVIVEEIFKRAQRGDEGCPFVLDYAADDRLMVGETTLDRAEVTSAVYRVRYLFRKKFVKNS